MAQVRGGLDLAQKPLGAERLGEFGAQDLHGHFAPMLEILGEIDGGHTALPQLALDPVTALEGSAQTGSGVGHQAPVTSE